MLIRPSPPQDLAVKAFDITSGDEAFVFSKLDAGECLFQADYKGLHMDHANPLLQVGGKQDTCLYLQIIKN